MSPHSSLAWKARVVAAVTRPNTGVRCVPERASNGWGGWWGGVWWGGSGTKSFLEGASRRWNRLRTPLFTTEESIRNWERLRTSSGRSFDSLKIFDYECRPITNDPIVCRAQMRVTPPFHRTPHIGK